MHVRSTTGFYGAEKVLQTLLPEINQQSDDMQASLFCIEGQTEDSTRLAQSLKHSSVTVFSAKSEKKVDFDLIRQLKKAMQESHSKIVQSHDYKSLVHARLATLGSNIRVVHQVHGGLNTTRSEKLYALVESFFINFVSMVFVVSKRQVFSPWRKPTLGISFVANGVELPDYSLQALPEKLDSLLIVARISAEKNHLLAVEVVQALKQRGLMFQLHIAGDGPLIDDVKQKVRALNLEEQIIFHGFVTDTESFYKKANLLLICSKTEGLPMNLLEALSYGMPVVSTGVGEIPEILEEGECGFVVNPDAEGFADKIAAMVSDRNRFQVFRENAMRTVKEKFSVQSQAAFMLEKYRLIISRYRLQQ